MSFIPNQTPTPPPPTPLQDIVFNTLANNALLIIFFIIVGASIVLSYEIAIFLRNKTKKRQLMFKDFNISQYSVVMFRKINDRYIEVEKKRIDVKENKWRYNNKDFLTFNVNNIAFSDKRNNYYAFDYDTGKQLSFKEKGMPDKITIEEVDIYVNRGIIAQLVQGLEEKTNKSQWLMLIVGVILGLGIGLIIGMYIKPTVEAPQAQALINGVINFVK